MLNSVEGYWALCFGGRLILRKYHSFAEKRSRVAEGQKQRKVATMSGKLTTYAPVVETVHAPTGLVSGKIQNPRVHAEQKQNQEMIIMDSRSQEAPEEKP